MNSNYTIALVFSKKDDTTIDGGVKGWVTNFHKFFSLLINQITQKNIDIKLIEESNFSKSKLDNYNVIIAIITPNLTNNENLIKSFNAHGKKLKHQKKLIIDGVPCFFKVLKGHYDDADNHLNEFEDVISYDFYVIDPLTGESHEFTRFFGNNAERGYWMKMVDMAYDIDYVLNLTREGDESDVNKKILREKTVYLASTGMDVIMQRDIIKRELMRHGYRVLPEYTLPKENKGLERMIRNDLKKSCLSIHLVGEDYGYKPIDSEFSVVDIQNKVASDYTNQMVEKNKNVENTDKQLFSRLIWVSPDLKNVTERQKIFIEDLKSDAATLEEEEVLQIQLQEFKTIIREELISSGRFKTRRSNKGFDYAQRKDTDAKEIYFIVDKCDIDKVDDIKSYLKKKSINVILPSYEGELTDLRYTHQENLNRCDASIIYCGESTENWVKTKLQDMLKAPGFGREKQLTTKAIYFRGQKKIDLGYYKKNKIMILGNNEETFSSGHLNFFLTKIENR